MCSTNSIPSPSTRTTSTSSYRRWTTTCSYRLRACRDRNSPSRPLWIHFCACLLCYRNRFGQSYITSCKCRWTGWNALVWCKFYLISTKTSTTTNTKSRSSSFTINSTSVIPFISSTSNISCNCSSTTFSFNTSSISL